MTSSNIQGKIAVYAGSGRPQTWPDRAVGAPTMGNGLTSTFSHLPQPAFYASGRPIPAELRSAMA